MTIGEQIKTVRKHMGLTQKELGELSKTSERTIQQYEAGKRQPRITQLQKIAYALGGSVSDIFLLDDNENIEMDDKDTSLPDIREIIEQSKESLKKATSFKNYLAILGYEVHESSYNDKWEITIKESGQKIYISSPEMDTLERTTKENIDLRITKYMSDGKHNQ